MKKFYLIFLIVLMFGAGLMHFIVPGFYLNAMPRDFSSKSFYIMLSAIAEIAIAVCLMIENTRKMAAIYLIALLLLFICTVHGPNIVEEYTKNGLSTKFWMQLIRFPIQFLLIYMALVIFNNPHNIFGKRSKIHEPTI